MPTTPILPLLTERFVIRPLVTSDAKAFEAAVQESMQTLLPWMGWCKTSFNQESALEWFATCERERAAGNAYDMGVFCRSSGEFLAGAGVNQISHKDRNGNIGYWVRQSRQRQGVAKEAVAALRQFGFAQLALFRLEIIAAVGNVASEAVAIASGAKHECVARNRLFLHGKPVDAHVFSLVPDA